MVDMLMWSMGRRAGKFAAFYSLPGRGGARGREGFGAGGRLQRVSTIEGSLF
jgi:hypothetical protein